MRVFSVHLWAELNLFLDKFLFFREILSYFFAMDEALIEVDALIKKIDKFESNFKKCSKVNRTEGYLEGRLEGLEEVWSKACEVDDRIEAVKTEANMNQSYFENDFSEVWKSNIID